MQTQIIATWKCSREINATWNNNFEFPPNKYNATWRCRSSDGQTIVELTGAFVDEQTIVELTGEFVDGQTMVQHKGEFVGGQTIVQLTL